MAVVTSPAREGVRPGEGLIGQPHRRHNPLSDTWVLVSAERTKRPWQGRTEAPPATARPAYDPTCYLCPGNGRTSGAVNDRYDHTFVFTNDHPALRPDSSEARVEDGLFRAEGEAGTCRVICFSPRHDLDLSRMALPDVRRVVDLWGDQTAELGERFRWVQVFENHGETMGASNPHPHGQIWAGTALPTEAAREDATQREHHQRNGTPLLLEYTAAETQGPRVVAENDEWLVVVPYWAAWPYETLMIPKRPAARLPDLDDAARDGLAASLLELLGAFDRLFDLSFPYSMGWHQAPFGDGDAAHWQLHAHFYPPLLQATVRKFMIGYELLSELQRDLTPEAAAERLREARDRVSG